MASDVPTPIVVELIGDLDATLVESLTERLAAFTHDGPTSVVLCARHLTLPTPGALAALGSAVDAARAGGASIAIDAGNRKMRLAFDQAKIEHSASDVPRPAGARHLMIARHAEASTLLAL
jgi:anti-anti-sigma regulatory factor